MGMTLVVLAAGIGSRYGGLKQIEAVGPMGRLSLSIPCMMPFVPGLIAWFV